MKNVLLTVLVTTMLIVTSCSKEVRSAEIEEAMPGSTCQLGPFGL